MRNSILKSALILFAAPFFFAGCANENSSPQTIAKTDSPHSIRISAPEIDAGEPAIAAVADGGVFAVWVEHGANKTADVFLQKFDAGGKPSGEKTRVNPNAGEAAAWRGDPPTIKVAAADGAIYVGWTKRVKTEAASGTDFYVSVSSDGGKTFQSTAKINDDSAPASHGMHSLAVDKNGKIYAAWLDERNIKKPAHAQNDASSGFQYVKAQHAPPPEHAKQEAEPNSEVFFAVSSDGGKTFSPNKKLAHDVCPCCKTALLAAPDGKIYAAWRQVVGDNFRHIAVASSADGGASFSAPAIVSDDRWQIAACPVSGASLWANGDTLRVAWFTAGAAGVPGVYQTYSTDGGKTFAPRSLVGEGISQNSPQFIGGESDVSHLVWEAGGGKQIFFAEAATPEKTGTAMPYLSLTSQFAAANSKGKLFAVFLKNEGKDAVWLTQIKQ